MPSNDNIITHLSGRVSTKIPPFHLIPRAALVAYANRLARGVRIKGSAAWNATSADQERTMRDRELLIERLGHVIDHASHAISVLAGAEEPLTGEDEADGGDAGAILFGGGLLAAVLEWEKKRKERVADINAGIRSSWDGSVREVIEDAAMADSDTQAPFSCPFCKFTAPDFHSYNDHLCANFPPQGRA